MPSSLKYLLLFILILGQFSCTRKRIYILTDTGNITPANSSLAKLYKQNNPNDIDFILFYNKNLAVKDSAEIKVIVNDFIRIIKRLRLHTSKLKIAPLVFENDTLGYLDIDCSGCRDFSVSLRINLKSQQMRYATVSGF